MNKSQLLAKIAELEKLVETKDKQIIELTTENEKLKDQINNKKSPVQKIKNDDPRAPSDVSESDSGCGYECKVCNKTYYDKSTLNKHLKSEKHKKMVNGEEVRKTYKCEHCEYSTKISTNFKNHNDSKHPDANPFTAVILLDAQLKKIKNKIELLMLDINKEQKKDKPDKDVIQSIEKQVEDYKKRIQQIREIRQNKVEEYKKSKNK
jgi:chromosome segregation ATPase